MGGDTADTPYFTWAQEIPLLPVGVFPYGINDSVLPGQSQTSSIQLWASGAYMDITVSLIGGGGVFQLNTTSCNLPAGGVLQPALTFTPPSLGAFTATLVVTGPNGTQDVPLRAVSSHGYHLVAADGGIFGFGDATFAGSIGGRRLNQPVVGMATTHDGGGYWLVAADGGIFNYGDAGFYGSMGGHAPQFAHRRAWPPTPDGGGYWEVAADGGVFSFGDAHFYGSRGGQPVGRVHRGHGGGRHGPRLLAGVLARGGLQLRGRRLLRLGGQPAPQPAGRRHGGDARRRRLLAGGLGRGRLQLRRRRLPGLHGRLAPRGAGGGHGGHDRRGRATGWSPPTGVSSTTATPGSSAPWVAGPWSQPVVGGAAQH